MNAEYRYYLFMWKYDDGSISNTPILFTVGGKPTEWADCMIESDIKSPPKYQNGSNAPKRIGYEIYNLIVGDKIS